MSTVASLVNTTDTPPATPLIPSMDTLLCELHPRKYKRVMEMESEWCDTNQKKIGANYLRKQTKSLTQVLQVLSEKNQSLASDLIHAVRESNPILNSELSKKKDKLDETNNTIVKSIKSF